MARRQSQLGLLLSLSVGFVNADLPYNPTQLFLSSLPGKSGQQIVYQLDPPSSSATNGRLRSISLDSSLNPSSLSYTTITASLPFLQADSAVAILSTKNPDETISTYAGACAADAQAAQLWRFTPSNSSSTGQGTWTMQTLSSSASQTQAAPNYLASSIAFSPTSLEADASIYTFAGMCPNQASSSESTWTADATYSNQLVQLEPSSSANSYVRQILSGKSQPIAEAGFSITPLSPAFSNSSTGVSMQQQNFLLLGGHTQAAFINMSQVALFSLPEATWTFLPIYNAATTTDLGRRDSMADIEPRSGHTAILSSDGTKVIVLGGWVGNVSTPADPQLAVLEIGTGYGGSSPSWTWTDTSSQQTPFDDGSGVYGHGAVLLPGNVIMATGGYSIAAPSSNTRRDGLTNTWFYNISSGSFLDSYEQTLANPSLAPTAEKSEGPLTTTSQKAGLGVGLTLGLLAIGLAGLFGWMYWRKLKRQHAYQQQFTVHQGYRDTYDRRIPSIQQPEYVPDEPLDEKQMHGLWNGNSTDADEKQPLGQGHAQSAWSSLREAERSGLDLDVPSPNRGLRKNRGVLASSTINFVDPRANRNSGAISPIDEVPEHERSSIESRRNRMDTEKNPFRDPSPEPSNAYSRGTSWRRDPTASDQGLNLVMPLPPAATAQDDRQRDMQTWMRDWKATDIISRRGSPDKSDRTVSSLSEQSQRATSGFRASDMLQYLPYSLNPFSDPRRSLTPSPDHSDGHGHGHGQDAFYTAQTSLHDLPATDQPPSVPASYGGRESEMLLGNSAAVKSGQNFSHSHTMSTPISPDSEPTFTFPTATQSTSNQPYGTSRPARRGTSSSRIGSWVGSVRRTLANPAASYQRSASINSISAANYMSNNYHNPTGGLVDADQYTEDGSASSSPTKIGGPRNHIKRKPVSFSGSLHKSDPHRITNDVTLDRPTTRGTYGLGYGEHDEDEPEELDDDDKRPGTGTKDTHLDPSTGDSPVVEPLTLAANKRRSSTVDEIVQRRVLLSLPGTRLRVVNPGSEDTDGRSETESLADAVTVTTEAPIEKKLNKVAQQVKRMEEERLKNASTYNGPPKMLAVEAKRSPASHHSGTAGA